MGTTVHCVVFVKQWGTNKTRLPNRWRHGAGQVWKLSMVCLHNNAFVARGTQVTWLHCGTPELRHSAIYIVSSVGTSFLLYFFTSLDYQVHFWICSELCIYVLYLHVWVELMWGIILNFRMLSNEFCVVCYFVKLLQHSLLCSDAMWYVLLTQVLWSLYCLKIT